METFISFLPEIIHQSCKWTKKVLKRPPRFSSRFSRLPRVTFVTLFSIICQSMTWKIYAKSVALSITCSQKYDYFWAHYIQDSISNLQGSTQSVSLLNSRFGNSLLTALNFLVIFYKTSYSCYQSICTNLVMNSPKLILFLISCVPVTALLRLFFTCSALMSKRSTLTVLHVQVLCALNVHQVLLLHGDVLTAVFVRLVTMPAIPPNK